MTVDLRFKGAMSTAACDCRQGVYSANLMTLAVIGNVTLDKLEEDVREMFGAIANREVNVAHVRQSRPDSGLGLQVNVLVTL